MPAPRHRRAAQDDSVSVWGRNLQLALFSVPLSLVAILAAPSKVGTRKKRICVDEFVRARPFAQSHEGIDLFRGWSCVTVLLVLISGM
jgi:hypothetical protein